MGCTGNSVFLINENKGYNLKQGCVWYLNHVGAGFLGGLDFCYGVQVQFNFYLQYFKRI